MSNDLFCMAEQSPSQHGSIFNQLLQHYSSTDIEALNPQVLFSIQEEPHEEQHKNQHKCSGEWVWADDDEFDNPCENSQEEEKNEPLTTDNFELKRVQSLRIQQEDKITMFLKKQSVMSIETDKILDDQEEPQRVLHSPKRKSSIITKSQSLSPKKCKSKKVDKFKEFRLL